MDADCRMMSFFALTLPNRPGELANFTAQLTNAGINILGLWSDNPGGAETRIACVPESAAAFRQFFNNVDMRVEEGNTIFVRDTDQPGRLTALLNKIADAKINVESIECVATGDVYGCFIWTTPDRLEELRKVLDARPVGANHAAQ